MSIIFSSVFEHQVVAARAISARLDAEGLDHVFIGGFACAVLGSYRATQDVDILIETTAQSISALRERLIDLDSFAKSGLKLYFVQRLPANLDDDTSGTVENSRSAGNVLIETLAAGTLGLPSVAGPVYTDPKYHLKILHPSVLPLTKQTQAMDDHAQLDAAKVA